MGFRLPGATPKESDPLTRLLQNLALAAAATLLALALCEAGLRLYGYRPIYEVYSKPSQFWQKDALLGWSHEPGATGMFVGPRPWPVEFETPVGINSLGLRGPEIEPKAPDELRVLFLGDSMVAGFEVPYEQTFVALLEEQLARQLGRPVRAINAGVRGYGTDQSYLYLRERGLALDPDVVVHFHSRNDVMNNVTIHRMRRKLGKPALRLTGSGLELVGAPIPDYPECSQYNTDPTGQIERRDSLVARSICAVQMRFFDHSALLTFLTLRVPWRGGALHRLYYAGMPSATTRLQDERRETARTLTTELVLSIARLVREQDRGFVLLSYDRGYGAVDGERLAAEDLQPIDLTEIGGERHREHQFKNDSHFNVRGHRAIADLLAPRIVEALPAP